MEQTPHGWTIVDKDAGVLFREYRFNASGGRSNTFAARMPDRKMLVLSPATRLPEAAYEELLEFGDVGAVVANNGFHHLGVAEWRRRFPQARFYAAPESAARIKKKNPEAGDFEPISALARTLDGDLRVREAPSTKCGETWAWAKANSGNIWFASDVLANIPELPKNFIVKTLFKLTKSGPGYKVFNLSLQFIAKDKKKMLSTMLEDLDAHPPSVIIPAHGAPLSQSGLAAETRQLIRATIG